MLNRSRESGEVQRGALSAFLLLVCVICCGPVWSAQPEFLRASQGAELSVDQAISLVKKQTAGRVLGVKTKDRVFRVKVLTPDGRVRHIQVDRASGAIIR